MNTLPIFKGYTVDLKLKEFRKAVFGKTPEFIPFKSQKGQKLMSGFLETPEGRRASSRNW